MKLFHATTPGKAKKYHKSGRVITPVRGFDTLQAAMFWAMKTNRTVIYEFESPNPNKLPDHHNQFGHAFWHEGDVLLSQLNCVVSTNKKRGWKNKINRGGK